MTRIGLWACVVGVAGVLGGCTVSTDPFTPISVSGSITAGGAPAAARIELRAGNFRTVRGYEGSYVISLRGGGVPASDCDDVTISAALLDVDGEAVLDEESRTLDACGDHVVDFAFP
jgi:hypothetical protein